MKKFFLFFQFIFLASSVVFSGEKEWNASNAFIQSGRYFDYLIPPVFTFSAWRFYLNQQMAIVGGQELPGIISSDANYLGGTFIATFAPPLVLAYSSLNQGKERVFGRELIVASTILLLANGGRIDAVIWSEKKQHQRPFWHYSSLALATMPAITM